MSAWESEGKSNDWYTPKYIMDALDCRFDLDVAAPKEGPRHVYAVRWFSIEDDALTKDWRGFVWMNPPFGKKNAIKPWLDKFFDHGNGIALTPDRTSCPWWQEANAKACATLFIAGKVKFERPDGTRGESPSTGTTLFASGGEGMHALRRAMQSGLGPAMVRMK